MPLFYIQISDKQKNQKKIEDQLFNNEKFVFITNFFHPYFIHYLLSLGVTVLIRGIIWMETKQKVSEPVYTCLYVNKFQQRV